MATALVCSCFDPETPGDTDLSADATAGTASEDAADDSGEAADGSGDAAPTCAEYCSLIGDHCEGDLEQYAGDTDCEAVCAVTPVGTVEDAVGNTVGCRTFHAINALEDPDTHCVHAGPAGAGVCGGNCETFCSLALALCTGDLAPWPDIEACLSDCAQFPDDAPIGTITGSGDSYACRVFHLRAASLQPEPHCSHLGIVSPVCAPT